MKYLKFKFLESKGRILEKELKATLKVQVCKLLAVRIQLKF